MTKDCDLWLTTLMLSNREAGETEPFVLLEHRKAFSQGRIWKMHHCYLNGGYKKWGFSSSNKSIGFSAIKVLKNKEKKDDQTIGDDIKSI